MVSISPEVTPSHLPMSLRSCGACQGPGRNATLTVDGASESTCLRRGGEAGQVEVAEFGSLCDESRQDHKKTCDPVGGEPTSQRHHDSLRCDGQPIKDPLRVVIRSGRFWWSSMSPSV